MNKEDQIAFCKIHRDAYYPMIKILYCDIEGELEPHLRLYSIVVKEGRLVPVHQWWHNTISIQFAIRQFHELVKMITDNYMLSKEDITREDLKKVL